MGSPMYYCGAVSTFYKEERPIIDPGELDLGNSFRGSGSNANLNKNPRRKWHGVKPRLHEDKDIKARQRKVVLYMQMIFYMIMLVQKF